VNASAQIRRARWSRLFIVLVLPRHNMNEQTEFGQNIAPLYSVIATGAELGIWKIFHRGTF